MNKAKLLSSLTFLLVLCGGVVSAQATRTWISGVGDDVNPCSRTAPCKTFAGAISKTQAGGEIDVLDPGGFGSVTITKALTLDGGAFLGSVLATSAANGITVNAGVADVVTLRNLSIMGAGTGSNGVRFIAGKALHIERCSISSFLHHGIDIQPSAAAQVFVSDTMVQDNGENGLNAAGTGTYVQVSLDNARFENNNNGVFGGDYTRFSIRNSAVSGNAGTGFLAQPNAGMSVMSIFNSTAGNNGTGIQSGGGSAPASVRLSAVSLFLNTSGLVAGANGTIASFGNNYNSGSGTPNASIIPQ